MPKKSTLQTYEVRTAFRGQSQSLWALGGAYIYANFLRITVVNTTNEEEAKKIGRSTNLGDYDWYWIIGNPTVTVHRKDKKNGSEGILSTELKQLHTY